MVIDQSQLNSNAAHYSSGMESGRPSFALGLSRARTIFVCHSHKDEGMVRGLIVHFRKEGMDFHVDWKDRTMVLNPDVTAVSDMKSRIKKCDYFFFLATANSIASNWCAWQMGCADACNRNIYIIPTRNKNDNYGNEYLGLYHHIGVWHDKEEQRDRVIAHRRGMFDEARFAVDEFR